MYEPIGNLPDPLCYGRVVCEPNPVVVKAVAVEVIEAIIDNRTSVGVKILVHASYVCPSWSLLQWCLWLPPLVFIASPCSASWCLPLVVLGSSVAGLIRTNP